MYNMLGGAIPGFFADQSPETLDFMMKTDYYTALWTAHVHSYFKLSNMRLLSMP